MGMENRVVYGVFFWEGIISSVSLDVRSVLHHIPGEVISERDLIAARYLQSMKWCHVTIYYPSATKAMPNGRDELAKPTTVGFNVIKSNSRTKEKKKKR